MALPKMTLLVRHLPSELDDQEKIDLLCHFGAESVRPMGTTGPLKHTAFARFATPEAAEKCLKRLHQIEILGRRLVVEYSKNEHEKHFPPDEPVTKLKPAENETVKKNEEKLQSDQFSHLKQDKVDEVFKRHNILYPKKPTLFYMYPPPTVSTLTNIANALASHPKFYTQVLHLMNKMNLPCPFGPVTPSPPLALENPAQLAAVRNVKRSAPDSTVNQDIEEIEMEYSSTEESELDSDTEKTKKSAEMPVRKSTKRPRKRMKLIQPDMSTIIKPTVVQNPGDVFEGQGQPSVKPAHIQFNLSEADILNQLKMSASADISSVRSNPVGTSAEHVQVVEGGFGKVEPVTKVRQEIEVQKPDVNYKISADLFLSKRQVTESRLKESQMKEFSVFKNYTPGEPTSRLYIKNLTKHTAEQDLVNLFGTFIDWDQELAQEAFDVRVMKEGKMKGQAFVTLPSEDDARRIVKECNGFLLNNKPMVIQFARSAKAKQVDKPIDSEN